ncbi:MAG: Gfo/Idh/MocA family oxidoreductase [Verrucomicrobia bacterium]|nr:Gfo/Idh/MocA family oxidoreductase [Verrucomicrobiota bacterium]
MNTKPEPSLTGQQQCSITRRQFIGGASAAALSVTILKPELVRGAAANSKINVGLIGCGGRGQWIADLFRKHGGYNVVAVADYFQDKADAAGDKLGVPAAKRFTGLSGHKRLLAEKLDAVAIESPPYFHPEQAAAAVDAGKHVYLAKPIAVDVPGCQTIAESGRKATEKKLAFLVDFQTRAVLQYQEIAKRVHAGVIGPIKTAEAAYQCSLYFAAMDAEFRKTSRDAAARLRAWAIDRVLSGDIITEQNIHALDVATWLLDGAPVKAVGTGGRAREFLGDCWDHFAVIYTFPNDVILTFSSKQFGTYDDIMCRVYGTTGTADTHYGGKVWVRGKEDAFAGETGSIYLEGANHNIAAFHDAIRKGDCANPTVAPSVRSNLTTILGRTAAYERKEVTWDEMMKANEKWEFKTKGLSA